MLLKDKVIVITGGAQGIGRECAIAYAAHGAKVVVLDKLEQSPNEAPGTLPFTCRYIRCDVSDVAEVEMAFKQILDQFSKIDAIHNNAGIANPAAALHDTSMEEWEQLMNINVKSVFLTTKFGIGALKKSRGSILNTSSLVGEIGQEMHAAYTATKGAMNALAKSMALDYAADGIRVNAIAPAGVWTPMLRRWNSEQLLPTQMENYLQQIHPLGYCPEGDVIADAAVFLISDMARFITGCILPVSGGAELGYRRILQAKD